MTGSGKRLSEERWPEASIPSCVAWAINCSTSAATTSASCIVAGHWKSRSRASCGDAQIVTPAELDRHQRWLWEGKQELLGRCAQKLDIDYDQLLASPQECVNKVIEFLDLSPTDEQLSKAVAYIDAGKRHVSRKTA